MPARIDAKAVKNAQGAAAPQAAAAKRKPGVTKAPAKPKANDGFEVAGAKAGGTTKAKGAYAALAAKGEYQGYVTTKSGKEVYVSVALAKGAATKMPTVLLDGISGYYDRNTTFEADVKKQGQSMISMFLEGQGETLAKGLSKKQTVGGDIEQEAQARLVIEVLDALGISAQVNIAGLSYGGAIAAQVEKMFPDRIKNVMLIAPYTESQFKGMENPWNPWGAGMFRGAVKAELMKLFPVAPDVLSKNLGQYHEALYRLTMGLNDFELDQTVKGMDNVHWLVVPEDGASPPLDNAEAYVGVKTGSFTSAPESEAGNHNLVAANSKLVAKWMGDVANGRVKAAAPQT